MVNKLKTLGLVLYVGSNVFFCVCVSMCLNLNGTTVAYWFIKGKSLCEVYLLHLSTRKSGGKQHGPHRRRPDTFHESALVEFVGL